MTHLTEKDEERVRAIIDELREVSPDDAYFNYMLNELERTIEEVGISPGGLDSLSPDHCVRLGND